MASAPCYITCKKPAADLVQAIGVTLAAMMTPVELIAKTVVTGGARIVSSWSRASFGYPCK